MDNPHERYYLRETARLLDMSPMTVKRALDELTTLNLLRKEFIKNQILYRANSESAVFKHMKITYNLAWLLEEKKIVDLIIDHMKGVSSIVLFGSYARGENDSGSDVDILVISVSKQTPRELLADHLGREVNLVNFSPSEWSKQPQSNKAFYLDVITEGIVLYGTRPVVA